MKAADWFARTLLLVLSGLATLSLLASLYSASKLPPGWEADRTPPDAASFAPASDPGSSSGGSATLRPEATEPAPPADSRGVVAPETAVPLAEPQGLSQARAAHWLEALTYAVLALAGFAAAGLIVLLRMSGALMRIADRN